MGAMRVHEAKAKAHNDNVAKSEDWAKGQPKNEEFKNIRRVDHSEYNYCVLKCCVQKVGVLLVRLF